MSHVTDIILVTFIKDMAAIVDETFGEKFGLRQVDRCAGGNKYMQCDVYMSAMNYLNIPSLIEWFKGINWEYPENAQLLYKDEHDDHFTLINYKEIKK